jgi:hypothetical protein
MSFILAGCQKKLTKAGLVRDVAAEFALKRQQKSQQRFVFVL